MLPSEIPIDPIMAECLDMIGKIREGVIDLSTQEKLAILQ